MSCCCSVVLLARCDAALSLCGFVVFFVMVICCVGHGFDVLCVWFVVLLFWCIPAPLLFVAVLCRCGVALLVGVCCRVALLFCCCAV